MILTIDGPAGSGKSTVAHKLATTLGFIHLNSGALFRAVGITARKEGLSLGDESALAKLSRALRFEFLLRENNETAFLVNGVDLTEQLHGEEVGAWASAVALLPAVRDVLLQVQRTLGEQQSLVVEGRDSGTIVFPNADRKFFLVANDVTRAERRLRQLLLGAESNAAVAAEILKKHGWSNESEALEAIRSQLAKRDRQDEGREVAPHRKAEDAVQIDTSSIGPDEVVEKIRSLL